MTSLAPKNRHVIAIASASGGHAFDHVVDPAAPDLDGQEFIRVHHQNPFGIHDFFVGRGKGQRVRLGLFAFGHIVFKMLHPTNFLQTHQHRVCAVATVVDVNADFIETDVLVVRDPFDKRMAFVLHHPSSTKLYTGVWPLHAAPLCLVHEIPALIAPFWRWPVYPAFEGTISKTAFKSTVAKVETMQNARNSTQSALTSGT